MMLNFAVRMSCIRSEKPRQSWPVVSALLLFALPMMMPGLVAAQNESVASRPEQDTAMAGVTQTGVNPAQAVAQPRPNWVITPSINLEGTYTDNVNLSPVKKSDFVTKLNPGIALDGKTGRATANLNYQWQHYDYAHNSVPAGNQRSLTARGQVELVEQWLFLEGSHNISQQSVSAFGTQSVGNESRTTNRSETAAYSISPYIQGRFANEVDYQLRYSGSRTRSDSGALAGGTAATTGAWTGKIAGATPLAVLGWSLNLNRQTIRNTNGLDSSSNNAFGTLTYQIDPQIRLSARAGRESDNFTAGVSQKRTTSGLGLDWAPTERTSVSFKKDRNAAGKGHSIDFAHRTALTAWKYSDSRSVTIPTPQMAMARTGTAFDLVYRQLESSFPDPVARAAEANRQLAQAGIGADLPIFGSLMTSQAFIQRRQQASVAFMGANNTVVLAFDRSNSERMGTGIGLADDFAANADIRQSGFNASWAHKLTPEAALTLNAGSSRSSGSSGLETSNRAWSLLLTTQLGAKTSASVGLRQTRFSSTAATGYDEQALTGAMKLKF